jgi:hypothetical protein
VTTSSHSEDHPPQASSRPPLSLQRASPRLPPLNPASFSATTSSHSGDHLLCPSTATPTAAQMTRTMEVTT